MRVIQYNAEKMALPPTVFLSGGFEEFEKRYPSFVSSTPPSSHLSMASKPSDPIGYPTVSDTSGCMSSTELSSYGDSYLEPRDPIGSTKTLSYYELTKMLKANESLAVSKLSFNEPSSKPLKNCASETSHEPVINRSKKVQAAAQIDKSRIISACLSKPNVKIVCVRGGLGPVFPLFISVPVIPSSALRRGLKNMGNTCYMNSTLQCLLHTPHLWYFFVTRQPFRGHLAQSFAEFVCKMTDPPSTEAYLPKMLKESFDRSHSMFADGQQQDSHEFLMILLDSLHEELNRSEVPGITSLLLYAHKQLYYAVLIGLGLFSCLTSDTSKGGSGESHVKSEGVSAAYLADLSWSRSRGRDDSVILDWFNGQLLSTVQCLTCNRCSHAFDEFMYLSVSIQGLDSTDLMKCIEEFFESEALSGENLWLCPQCKIPCEAVKTFGIWRLPEYLIIHLKRFRSYITCEKIDSYVYFPLTGLNLSDFTKNIAVSDCIYDLYGVINHHGSVQSGHYTAFCFDSADHQWRNFDDSRVTELSEAEIRTRAAYVLFYKRSRVSTKTA
ncbi:Ubiquitin carboxyl-terminal hydrolase 8 [Taenia solium]|eukprot:TsM_000265200 transcript=TsM_000265200 gene=TsM_000265200